MMQYSQAKKLNLPPFANWSSKQAVTEKNSGPCQCKSFLHTAESVNVCWRICFDTCVAARTLVLFVFRLRRNVNDGKESDKQTRFIACAAYGDVSPYQVWFKRLNGLEDIIRTNN